MFTYIICDGTKFTDGAMYSYNYDLFIQKNLNKYLPNYVLTFEEFRSISTKTMRYIYFF